jgi:hypothetical protein
MRKFLLSLFLLLVVLAGQQSSASSEFEKYSWPPVIDSEKSADRTTGYSWVSNDSFVGDARGGEGVSRISVAPDVQPSCTSFLDPFCVNLITSGNSGWWSNMVLDACAKFEGRYPCIEGVSIMEGQNSRSLTFDRYVPTNTWQPDDSRNVPPGGAASLWKDPSGSDDLRYLVIFAGPISWPDASKPISGVPSLLSEFQASITATKVLKGDFKPDFRSTNEQGIPQWVGTAPLYCLWVAIGECGYKTEFPSGAKFQLSSNIPNNFSGFLIGRMKDPTVEITPIARNMINLKVTAEPIMIPLLKGVTRSENASKAIIDHFNNPEKYFCPSTDATCRKGMISIGTASSGTTAFEYFSLFESYFAKEAALMVPVWSFRNHPANLGQCSNSSYFQGLVSTNAAIYEGDPPKLIDGELVYRVAGVHLDSAGRIFQGSYDLLIQSSVGRCLYKLDQRPIRATISIQNTSGENLVYTTSFREKDGWIKMSANGFTFSQPTIKVALRQDESAPLPTPTPSASPTIKPVGEKKSITCVKGKRVKKVVNENPKCPKGFKKR